MDAAVTYFWRALSAWGRANRRSFPWREMEDPWCVLVAEVLLQRSRGKTVANVYEELFRRWPDALALSRAREHSIADVIRPLGLLRRAGTLRAMAREVVRLGGVPGELDSLVSLPGVGRYAASTTLVVAFGKPVPVVDGVSARVYRRYLGLTSDLPAASDPLLWDQVARATPPKASKEWNWAVLDLAAEVCLPARPRCSECPLAARCAFASSAA
jgi:A/G-specific adenine glycosylase